MNLTTSTHFDKQPPCFSPLLLFPSQPKHRKQEFLSGRWWAVWTRSNPVDKSRYTFYTQKPFSGSQKCQDSVTGCLNNFIGLGFICLGSAGSNLAKLSISISRCWSDRRSRFKRNTHSSTLALSLFLWRKRKKQITKITQKHSYFSLSPLSHTNSDQQSLPVSPLLLSRPTHKNPPAAPVITLFNMSWSARNRVVFIWPND